MPDILPVVVPTLSLQQRKGSAWPARSSDLPVPITLTATRGPGTPLPARDISLTFHMGGQLGRDPSVLYFDRTEDLLPRGRSCEIPGLEPKIVDEIRARYWDMCRDAAPQSDIWACAQAACGFTKPSGKTPWGDFRVHQHDAFLAYSCAPRPQDVGPFLRLSDIRNPRLALDLAETLSPDREVFVVSWIIDAARSSHERLKARHDLETWLDWLCNSEGWPTFASVIELPAVA